MTFDLSSFNVAFVHTHANSTQDIAVVVRIFLKNKQKPTETQKTEPKKKKDW